MNLSSLYVLCVCSVICGHIAVPLVNKIGLQVFPGNPPLLPALFFFLLPRYLFHHGATQQIFTKLSLIIRNPG